MIKQYELTDLDHWPLLALKLHQAVVPRHKILFKESCQE